MRVLIVEDERRLADALCQIMKGQKYGVDAVYDGQEGFDYAMSGQYDVVVLDVMLPRKNGFEVVRALRAQNNPIPVLLLTAREEIADKVTGLDCGADDYMTKPFSPEELLARVRALSRRQGEVQLEELRFDDLCLGLSTRSLSRREKEFEVLRILLSNPKRIVPKEDLLTRVWGTDSDAEDNNVEAYISFLRKKLAYLGSRVGIGTVRKVGYRLEIAQL